MGIEELAAKNSALPSPAIRKKGYDDVKFSDCDDEKDEKKSKMGKSKKTEEKSKKTEMAAAPTPKDPPKKEKEKERDIQPTQAQTPASKTPAPISQASQQQPKGISRTAPTPMPPPIKSTKEFAPKESNASNVVDNTGTSTKVGESEDVTRTQSKKTKKGGSCCTIL